MADEPSEPDWLPLSMLNQVAYCERRFYLMFVLGEMEYNAHVVEGQLRNANTHQAGRENQGEREVHRQVYVWSEALGLAGFADIVEEQAGRLYPVEYKKGVMGKWISDHVQLCAQGMCLEERLGKGQAVEQGAIFYFGSRRREEVVFTPELRERTRAAVRRARQLVGEGLPEPLVGSGAGLHPKCRDCSLEPVCLPHEVRALRREV